MTLNNKKIVYVDDDEDDLYYFNKAVEKINHGLTMKGYTSSTSFMGEIHGYQPYEPLIFLDINMPVKNGFQLLKEIRSDQALNSLKVIIYSTSNDEKTISISRDLGASLYVVKPARIDQLKDMIERVISRDWNNSNAHDDFVIN